MRMTSVGIVALMLLGRGVASAQDLTGDWQGAIAVGPSQLRLIVHIDKTSGGAWKATMASIDQSPDWGAAMPIDTFTADGSTIAFGVAPIRGSYTGTVASDGRSIAGTWSQGASLPLTLTRATADTAWKDPSPHAVQFVPVDQDVKLEVLDWGGPSSGASRTLVLLAGLGNTAHVFDRLAAKLTAQCHVYGITRRGFGASSAPPSGYAADRLGDDVVAVIEALKVNRPVLAGHSLGGEELSSIGSRFPERVAGLIYLDAGYGYAFYAPGLDPIPPPPQTPLPPISQAIMTGFQRYTKIPVPILAIFALPHDRGPAIGDAAARAAAEAKEEAAAEAQAKAFEAGLPTARVVRMRANHYVFLSHEADVLREVNAFVAGLK